MEPPDSRSRLVVNTEIIFEFFIWFAKNDIERLKANFIDITITRLRIDRQHIKRVIEEKQMLTSGIFDPSPFGINEILINFPLRGRITVVVWLSNAKGNLITSPPNHRS